MNKDVPHQVWGKLWEQVHAIHKKWKKGDNPAYRIIDVCGFPLSAMIIRYRVEGYVLVLQGCLDVLFRKSTKNRSVSNPTQAVPDARPMRAA